MIVNTPWWLIAEINDSISQLRTSNLPLAPHERRGVLVVDGSECMDGRAQLLDTVKAGVLQRLALKDAEPDFNLVEPARAGRGEATIQNRPSGRFAITLLEGVCTPSKESPKPRPSGRGHYGLPP
jgi:hypothetical protein